MVGTADVRVRALRQRRRANRVEQVDWFESFYRIYLATIFGAIGVALLADAIAGPPLSEAVTSRLRDEGGAAVGLVAAVAVWIGLRSGARGGPLAFEQADVRHLLTAPVPRRAVVLPLALKQLRTGALGGLVVGAASGSFAASRLRGDKAEWVWAGALFGLAVALLALGAAYAVSSVRIPHLASTFIGAALAGWSAADWADGTRFSPLTRLGSVALAPLAGWSPLDLAVGAALAAAGVVVALWRAAHLSVERAELRSKLVGELRFAATLRDVRTVLVLHRQLAQDWPRSKPWARVGSTGRLPVWRRDWHGILRWPLPRLLRLAVLAASAGAALALARDGSYVFYAPAAAAVWLAALDASEPLAQEMDHPGLVESYPRPVGRVLTSHLPATAVVLTAVSAAVFAVAGEPVAAAPLLALSATAGAAMTLITGPPPPFDPIDILLPPEAAAFRKAQQVTVPVLVAGVGLALWPYHLAAPLLLGAVLMWARRKQAVQ